MPGIPDLSRDLAREYRICQADAKELIQFISQDIIVRLGKGQALHIDLFGSFHYQDGKVQFNPSKFMLESLSKIQAEQDI